MRILQDYPDWRDQYIVDVQTAKDELEKSSFSVKPKKLVADIYALPAKNHQTFFARMIFDHDIYKMIYAKAIENSVWFSDPIYKYTFIEALRFKDDPKRKGRIVCGVKLVKRSSVSRFLDMVGRISPSQPVSAVHPDEHSHFTAIRVYKEGSMSGEYLFTDAALLRLSDGYNTDETIEYLNTLHLKIEDIIGIGCGEPET